MAWFSIKERGGGVDLRDPRTLSRSKLTSDVIELLENERVVFIASPQTTGKTSLAALVCQELLNRSLRPGSQQTKTEIASISILEAPRSTTFADAFDKMCDITWEDLLSKSSDGYTVYIVVDNVQILYKDFAIQNADEFWKLVELVQTNKSSNIRVLMLSSFGSSDGAPVAIPQDATIGMERLNFTPAEVQEYLKSWFLGNESLGDSENFFNFSSYD